MVILNFINIESKIVFVGGQSITKTLKKILEFNFETESWTEIGSMKEERFAHAVSAVVYEDYVKWCKSQAEKTTEPPR